MVTGVLALVVLPQANVVCCIVRIVNTKEQKQVIYNITMPRKIRKNYTGLFLKSVNFITVTFILCGLNISVASELSADMKQCAKEQNTTRRLNCYDSIAEKYQLTGELDFITPPSEFLSSRLTVTPWHSEYTLTVEGFFKLIKNAVMDSGEKIEIHGWTRDGHDYVLNITMRHPIRLRFLPMETATDEIPLSLLRTIIIDGEKTDAGLFITTIASMTPDKK